LSFSSLLEEFSPSVDGERGNKCSGGNEKRDFTHVRLWFRERDGSPRREERWFPKKGREMNAEGVTEGGVRLRRSLIIQVT